MFDVMLPDATGIVAPPGSMTPFQASACGGPVHPGHVQFVVEVDDQSRPLHHHAGVADDPGPHAEREELAVVAAGGVERDRAERDLRDAASSAIDDRARHLEPRGCRGRGRRDRQRVEVELEARGGEHELDRDAGVAG